MEEDVGGPNIGRRPPDFASALLAFEVAEGLLVSAKNYLDNENFPEALSESKNAIRTAASALLLKEGYVASTLESTISYLEHNHPSALPVENWRIVENMNVSGLFSIIMKLLKKSTDQGDVNKAILIAEEFLNSAKNILEDRK